MHLPNIRWIGLSEQVRRVQFQGYGVASFQLNHFVVKYDDNFYDVEYHYWSKRIGSGMRCIHHHH
jgi:hypothetical protein